MPENVTIKKPITIKLLDNRVLTLSGIRFFANQVLDAYGKPKSGQYRDVQFMGTIENLKIE